jgi:hypothetical protein
MPSISPCSRTVDCIRDFIACVVHGIAIGAIPSSEGTRLLYRAQVAHSALSRGRKAAQKAHQKRTKYAIPCHFNQNSIKHL